jgi:hypothetical protein
MLVCFRKLQLGNKPLGNNYATIREDYLLLVGRESPWIRVLDAKIILKTLQKPFP